MPKNADLPGMLRSADEVLSQPALNTTLQLRPQLDLKSSITHSAKIDALAPPALTAYILAQLDLAGLPHHTFTDDALGLILRISEGTLLAAEAGAQWRSVSRHR
jgi:hypothetical protein